MIAWNTTAQKMKFFIKDFFGKCGQIRRKLLIWSHLLKKSLIENFIFLQWNFSWNKEIYEIKVAKSKITSGYFKWVNLNTQTFNKKDIF